MENNKKITKNSLYGEFVGDFDLSMCQEQLSKKEITITVGGVTNTGKSRILYLLKSFLKENGFDVKFDGGGDFVDEDTFDSHMCSNIEQVSGYIKESRTIVMREQSVYNGYNGQ